MVERKKALNKPCFKINAFPVLWLHEVKSSEWFCRNCSKPQKGGNVAFEILARFARKGEPGKEIDKPIRLYLCMDCAELLLDTALDKVRLCKRFGADGFEMVTSL